VLATAGLFWVGKGDWLLGSVLFVLGNVGLTGTLVFYDSLLPHVARRDELDRVATAGFALGYLGGGLLFALNLLWIQQPHWFGIADDVTAIRLSFLSASVWWLLFSIPLFLYVPEPETTAAPPPAGHPLALVAGAFANLRRTFADVARYRDAFLFLLAFMLFSDGISTIIRMATIFGTELGIARGALIGSVLMVQFVGVPCAFAFGALAGRIGTKPAIYLSLCVYLGITLLAFFMTNATQFFVLAFLVALVQGGSQALSRSLFATLIPPERSSEFYGFFGVFEKFGAVFGPMVFTLLLELTGSSRLAVLALAAFFVAGGAVLSRVDVEAGQRAATAPA
jgi:UMF1 family MFS transporter